MNRKGVGVSAQGANRASHPFPLGPHRVESWKLKAGCWPLKEKLFRRGKGQADVKGELGGGEQRSGGFRGAERVGVTRTGQGTDPRLTRRSAQEKSFFFLPGAQLAGRPAASVGGGQPCPTLS